MYSEKSGCTRDKVDVIGQSCCIFAKWLYSGESGCIRVKVVVFGQSCCIRASVVVFGQKWLYLGKFLY